MKIDNAASYLFAQRAQGTNAAARADGAASFAATLAEKTQAASSNGASTPAAQFEKFDFTNMTPKALHETVNSLIRSGQMDLDESSSLLGFMAPSALSKVSYDGNAPASSNQSMNVFSKIQEGIEGALSRNEQKNVESLQRAADALLRFQGQISRVNIQA